MKKKVQDLLGSVIISCQAYEDTPLYGSANMKIMAESAKLGGARAGRFRPKVKNVRSLIKQGKGMADAGQGAGFRRGACI